MTESLQTLGPAQMASARIDRSRSNWLNPLEALESGFGLFRATFGTAAWGYYAGSAPLIICFIPIWVINGQIRLSNGEVFAEAVLLAGAYFLRIWAVARYMQRVRERAFGVPRETFKGAVARAAALGRLFTWKLGLTAAVLITSLTFAGGPWFYAASQFASLEAREDSTERHSLVGCLALAGRWYAAGLLLFLMLMPLWITAFLNFFAVAIIVPAILHSIFGLNTLLSTDSGITALTQSSAFWLSLLTGTWMAIDPVVKCTYVIVYQHLRSRREGDDLRGALASLPRGQQKKTGMLAFARSGRKAVVASVVLLGVTLFGAAQTARALAVETQAKETNPGLASESARQARVQKLSDALDKESRSSVYRWHDAEHPNPPNWFDKAVTEFEHTLLRLRDAIWNALRKMWPWGLHLSLGSQNNRGWHLKDVRLWLALIVSLTVTAGGFLIWLRRRRGAVAVAAAVETAPLPDLTDTAVASERSEDEWFSLANRLESEGELRLAFRAAYLGLLSGLAQREWLTIRRDRTNREYLDEFTRRWKRRPQAAMNARGEVPENLRKSMRLFDRVWYGYGVLTPAAVTTYRQDQRELLDRV